jgi:hypothetical protein
VTSSTKVSKMELWQSLPPDLRASLLLCLCAAAPLGALYLFGRLVARRQPDSLLPLSLVAGGALAMGSLLSLYLDRQPTLPGVVEAKEESIEVTDARWTHTVRLQVRYRPPGTAEARSDLLVADPGLYDRLTIGDPVEVRYLHLGGWFSFARISARSTLSIVLGSDLNLLLAAAVLGLLMMVGLSWGWVRSVLGGLLVVVVLPIAILLEPMHQWRTAAPLVGPQAEAQAAVLDVTRVTEVGGGEESEPDELWQPVDLVQVEFVPRGGQSAVRGADLIDADSLSLEPGDEVTVRYLTGAPRVLHLAGGTRSYGLKNSVWLITIPVATLALAVVAARTWSWLRRRSRSATQGVPREA